MVLQGVAETTAKELAATTVDDGLKYTFVQADLETAAFFSVKSIPDIPNSALIAEYALNSPSLLVLPAHRV